MSPRTRALPAIFKAQAGVRGAFVFPVKAEGHTIGVFTFHSREIGEPDAQLLASTREIGERVGGFLHRKSAEIA